MKENVYEKNYAGLLGMDAGMRLGAPVENIYWTYDRLREYYGDIRNYLRTPRTMTADDDVNGPVIFLRGLTDNGTVHGLTPEMVGEAWLNYARRGMGMFWWGGEDLSTEHRAYMNLKRGVKAPRSGSAELNGLIPSEQIGGQIFVDTWGLIWPGDPDKAAEYAAKAASVSHDGNGVYGGAFMAACVAAAFEAESVDEVLDAGLQRIPADSDYAKAVKAVRAFHAQHPEDFRACRDYVERTFPNPLGYHIVPNAAICILAMLYGGGDLGRSIEISVMCGFDTDCNASNIGTILGVLGGIEGVPERYRRPINDTVVLSSVSGYLNVVDLPSYAKELLETACLLRGEALPAEVVMPPKGEIFYDFELPGALHGLEMDDWSSHNLRHTRKEAHTGRGSAELMIDGKNPCGADLFFKSMYIRADLNEERYEPVFTPRVSPGQRVSAWMKFAPVAPGKLRVTPFLTRAMTGERLDLPGTELPAGEWAEVAFTVPGVGGDEIHDIGWHMDLILDEPPWAWDKVFIDDITVTGGVDYAVDFSIQRKEFGQVTPFAFNDAVGELENGSLVFTMPEDPLSVGSQAFTGNYYLRDTVVEAETEILQGESAMLLLRGQGTRRYYALGFAGEGKAAILRYESGVRTGLATAPFAWERERVYRLTAAAEGDSLTLSVDGKKVLTARDGRLGYGMAGLGQDAPGASRWREFHLQGSY